MDYLRLCFLRLVLYRVVRVSWLLSRQGEPMSIVNKCFPVLRQILNVTHTVSRESPSAPLNAIVAFIRSNASIYNLNSVDCGLSIKKKVICQFLPEHEPATQQKNIPSQNQSLLCSQPFLTTRNLINKLKRTINIYTNNRQRSYTRKANTK